VNIAKCFHETFLSWALEQDHHSGKQDVSVAALNQSLNRPRLLIAEGAGHAMNSNFGADSAQKPDLLDIARAGHIR
jgi:hypothetical protein